MIDEWGKGAKYWNKAWNPVIGCRKVSEGCANCYADGMAERFPELQDSSGGFEPHTPKRMKNPPRSGVVFVGNMTDIFGELVKDIAKFPPELQIRQVPWNAEGAKYEK